MRKMTQGGGHAHGQRAGLSEALAFALGLAVIVLAVIGGYAVWAGVLWN
jgi:hypothetical protein